MELRKTNENVTRTFDAEGNAQESVDSVNFDVVDAEGKVIGNANINGSYAGMSLNIYDATSIEDGEAKLREILSIDK